MIDLNKASWQWLFGLEEKKGMKKKITFKNFTQFIWDGVKGPIIERKNEKKITRRKKNN